MGLNRMTTAYWDDMADTYEEDVHSVADLDLTNMVSKTIRAVADRKQTACDFGCGVGKFLPILAERFATVTATDISKRSLQCARRRAAQFSNIRYERADLTKATTCLGRFHFGLSVNVAIMPSHTKQTRVLESIARHIRRGGHLVLVVPSLESALFANYRLIEWNLRAGQTYRRAASDAIGRDPDEPLGEGVVKLDGVPTKHYLKEELEVKLKRLRLTVLDVKKVVYSWRTEFHQPPRWMQEPLPWDWLCVARKR